MTEKRRLLFDPAPPGKRKKISPLEDAQFFKIAPIPGCDPKTNNEITFTYTTGKDPIRFLQEPILIKYRATSAATDVIHNEDGMYIDPVLGVSTFVESCEISLDNTVVYKDNTGRHSLYQALNRKFTTAEMRKKVGMQPGLIFNDKDLAKTGVDDEIVKAGKLMVFGTGGGTSRIITGSLDGNPLLGTPRNLSVECLTDGTGAENNRPAVIPPFTTITIKLNLRADLKYHVFLTKSDLSVNGVYWRTTKPTGNTVIDYSGEQHAENLKINIEECSLLAERLFFSEEKSLKPLKGDNISYYFDFPTYVITGLPAQSYFSTSFIIPPGTPLVYVTFLAKHQLIPDTLGKRPSDPTKFVLPPNLTKILFRLNNRPILFETGLEVLAATPQKSTDYKMYHNYLVEENLTDLSYEDFCPRANRSYNNVFVLNLCDAAFAQPAKLVVEMTFSDSAPTNWYCTMVMPTEQKFRKTKAGWDNTLAA